MLVAGAMGVLAMRPSRQELNRRRRRGSFVGRSRELEAFQGNLTRHPDDDAFQYLFHVHGQAGVGKSSLVRQWDITARELGAATALLDDDAHGVIEVMEAISLQLAQQGARFREFSKQLALYYQRRAEAEVVADSPGLADAAGEPVAAPAASSTLAAQASLAGLGLLPGIGAVAGAVDPHQLARGADRLRTSLRTRFRSQSDGQLALSPLRALTPVFLADLAAAAERRPWLVLFFDVFEQTGPLLNNWLRDVLIIGEYGDLPNNVVAVLSGQGSLDRHCWRDHLDLIAEVPLDVFTEDEARRLLAARGVVGEDVIQVILHMSGRLPVLVDALAQNRPRDVGEIEDPSDTAVERFLKWIIDPQQQNVARSCSLPLHLDEDVYRAIAPELLADQYLWLRSLPFVTGPPGRSRYHDVVRAPMIRLHRTQSPAWWRQQQNHLADVYLRRCRRQESALPSSDYWGNSEWRECKLHATYHRLCADSTQALPDALHETVLACEHGVAVVRRWAQMFLQAGYDADSSTLRGWGQCISASATETDDAASGTCGALTRLIAAPVLPVAGRALAYVVRADERRAVGDYDGALADYASALALAPGLNRAHCGVGETQRLAGRYEEALTSFTRAIYFAPEDVESVTGRGYTYLLMGRHEDALADYNRAIALSPSTARPIASRGETFRFMGRYDEALADLTRALELSPNYVWPRTSRGAVYSRLGNYDAALADLNRVIEADSDDGLVYFHRGEMFRAMGRFGDAVADFSRALEIGPECSWILYWRGDAYQSMRRYGAALADLNRVIEADSDDGLGYMRRGKLFRAMGRFGDAVADFSRALELGPEYAWALCRRGDAYRSMGRNEDSLTDLACAIERKPENGWLHLRYAIVLQILGRAEACHHFQRAVDIYSRKASISGQGLVHARGNLMVVYCATLDWEKAAEELERFLECDPSVSRIIEALDDLIDLQEALSLNSPHMQALQARLHARCGPEAGRRAASLR